MRTFGKMKKDLKSMKSITMLTVSVDSRDETFDVNVNAWGFDRHQQPRFERYTLSRKTDGKAALKHARQTATRLRKEYPTRYGDTGLS